MNIFKNLAMLSIAAVMFVACGGDNGSSAKDEDSSSSVADEEKSSSSTKNSSSSDKESSSSAKESSSSQSKYVCDIYTLADALSCKCDENREGKLSYNYDSNVELVCIHDAELNKWGWIVKKEESSSSSAKSSSSTAKSSSSVASSSSAKSSSSTAKSSSSVASSSSAKSSSSSVKSSSSSAKSSSSSVKVSSSSSEYAPFNHILPLGYMWQDGAYKRFTDERNGRSYYYITIEGETPGGVDATVTIMAENLNIGTMVNGENDQNNDDVIERYCYDNDTTKCDEFGGLYQWAEMMALPSRCNTESCADLIENKHRGICPDGWRLMTYRDFYIAWHAKTNTDGIAGVRSSWGFTGSNESGLSLTGAGKKSENSKFLDLKSAAYWFYPVEYKDEENIGAYANYVMSSSNSFEGNDSGAYKTMGLSVRCVKVE